MPASKPRRAKKDPELVRRLDEVRQVMKDRRTEAERRAAATMDAVETYLHAAGVIRHGLVVRDQRIGELRRQIEQIEREHEAEATQWRSRQASAVATMRGLGESDDSIGALLEMTGRQLRQLMSAAARTAERATLNRGGPDRGTGATGLLDAADTEVRLSSQDA
ncbi:hypothetical protein ACFWM1_26250 [Nocardia sp. NPDC058379]|uniref:hypothetical protein n=1 Tax=unclassified Nocardia TaxID=2637762 RepID=UPI0036521BDE